MVDCSCYLIADVLVLAVETYPVFSCCGDVRYLVCPDVLIDGNFVVRQLLLLMVFFGLARISAGQTCPTGSAAAILDGNEVTAAVYNNGGLFRSDASNEYRVPNSGDAHAMFYANLWIAGTIEDSLRMAGSIYDPHEFWPGPLHDGAPGCEQYDRIYSVTRSDLVTYGETGVAVPDLREWPWTLGAPVIDGDGVDDNYNLAGGDRPAIVGDETLWWIMNDGGGAHAWSRTEPVSVEVRVTAMAISSETYHSVSMSTPELDDALDHASFYRYEIAYRGALPLEDAYVGLYVDPDLGDAADDRAGSDTTLGMGFLYNGDDFDGLYGERPPAIGVDFVEGVRVPSDGLDNDGDGLVDEEGERLGMTSFVVPINDATPAGTPFGAVEAYRSMQARWRDGTPVTFGGIGYDGDQPTQFMYPDEPGTFWSEEDHGESGASPAGDRRFVAAMGPVVMQPGEQQDFTVAIVWARGTDRLDSVQKLKQYDALTQQAVDLGLLETGPQWLPATTRHPEPKDAYQFRLGMNLPNPFSETTLIPFELADEADVRLSVHDLLGRETAVLIDGRLNRGHHDVQFDAADLAAGVYFVRMETNSQAATRPILVVR